MGTSWLSEHHIKVGFLVGSTDVRGVSVYSLIAATEGKYGCWEHLGGHRPTLGVRKQLSEGKPEGES